jgi:hypothetical protein
MLIAIWYRLYLLILNLANIFVSGIKSERRLFPSSWSVNWWWNWSSIFHKFAFSIPRLSSRKSVKSKSKLSTSVGVWVVTGAPLQKIHLDLLNQDRYRLFLQFYRDMSPGSCEQKFCKKSKNLFSLPIWFFYENPRKVGLL